MMMMMMIFKRNSLIRNLDLDSRKFQSIAALLSKPYSNMTLVKFYLFIFFILFYPECFLHKTSFFLSSIKNKNLYNLLMFSSETFTQYLEPSDKHVHTKMQQVCAKNQSTIKVKLTTFVEGDQKAPFSIATILRCRGGRYSFPWIAPLYLWYVPYVAEC